MQPVQLVYATSSALDAGIPWQQCSQGYQKGYVGVLPASADANADIDISADSAESSGSAHDKIDLSGKVSITQDGDTLLADQVSLNRTTGQTLATGDVFIKRAELRLGTQQADYNLNSKTGKTSAVEYRLGYIPARGSAQQSELLSGNRSRFQDISYTTCQPDSNAWHLAAGELELDQNEGIGTAYHATLSVGNLPIAYLPVISFPIDDRRRSGVLPPTIGYSQTNGYDLTVPYYFNLAPNYDLTLSPRMMSERGVLFGAEFRFLSPASQGTLAIDYLPKDNLSTEHDERGSLSFDMATRFTTHLTGSMEVEHVSDSDYLNDLGGSLASSSTTLLKRFAELRYANAQWDITGRVKHYQSLGSSKPYSLLPQLTANATFPNNLSPLTYHLYSELSQFNKDNTVVEGTRVNLQPAISYPIEEDFYHLRPKLGVQYTAYKLDNHSGDHSPDRLLPIFSLDSGLYFERDTHFFGSSAIQTLEPRLSYLFVPHRSQDDLPRFDVGQRSFNTISSLFSENRFTSTDRLGDANQLTLALTTRFNDAQSGREYLNASVGQTVYFRDREVTLSGTPETTSSSSIIGELNTEFAAGWRGRSNIRWNPHDNEVQEALAQLSYRDANDRILNLAYRLNEGIAQHTDVAAIWPLSKRFKLLGRWHYSLEENNTLEGFAGLEYGSCCWRVRALSRYYDDDNDGRKDVSFFLQFELKGLGKLGSSVEDLLTRGVYGYRKEDD